jgi:copper chaperone
MDTLKIKGMSCQHCVAAVTKALEKFPELSQVQVDLQAGQATFVNNGADRKALQAAIKKIGFEPLDWCLYGQLISHDSLEKERSAMCLELPTTLYAWNKA